MKRFFKSFLKKQTPTSTLTTIESLHPSLDILALLSEQVDRRHILQTIAKHTDTSEQAISQAVAQKLLLPFEQRPAPVKVFRTARVPSLAVFAQFGALPLMQQGEVAGVICIEPLWLKGVIPEEFQRNIKLSTWEAINTALHASHEVYLSDNLPIEDEVVEVIASRVAEYGGKGFSLATTAGELFYSFTTPEGTPAQGKVHESVRTKLLSRVSNLASYFDGIIIINGTKYEVSFNETGEVIFQRKFHIQVSDELAGKQTKHVPVKHLARLGVEKSNSLPQKLSVPTGDAPQNSSYIIIIEDSPLFAKTLQRFLSTHGIEVKHFPLATAALHYLEEVAFPPCLIVCDLYLPEMSGKGFLDILRSRFSMLALPVIILTSDDRIETELDLLRSGAVALLSKQEDPRKLSAHIERVLQSNRLPSSLPHATGSR